MDKIICIVCGTPVPKEEISQYNQFSGLPSPCCNICFEVADHSDKTIDTVIAKSLLKRAEKGIIDKN